MATLQYKQDILGGIVVGVDPLDMNAENSPALCNVDITKPGQLESAAGTEKQITTGYATGITAIHQIEDSNISTIVDTGVF